jgi:hypothetical protein
MLTIVDAAFTPATGFRQLTDGVGYTKPDEETAGFQIRCLILLAHKMYNVKRAE